MVLRKWLSSFVSSRPQTNRPRRRSLNQPQKEMKAAAQLAAESLETRQLLSAVISGIDPDHGVSASDELTNAGTFDLHGTATGDSVLQITRNGNFVGAILVNSDGAWRFAQTNLAEGTFEFAANDGEGSSSLTVHVDKTAPTTTLASSLSASQPTNAATLPISLNFSEAVDGLSLGDLVIGNGTASNLSGSGASYTFDVTPTSDGAVTIGLNSNTVIDLAGNANGVSAALSIDSDRTAPAVPSVSNPSGATLTNAGSATIAGSADAVCSLVAEGLGLSILSRWASLQHEAAHRFCCFPLARPGLRTTWHAVTRADAGRDAALMLFLDRLGDCARRHGPESSAG